jgi:hypothetical protein
LPRPGARMSSAPRSHLRQSRHRPAHLPAMSLPPPLPLPLPLLLPLPLPPPLPLPLLLPSQPWPRPASGERHRAPSSAASAGRGARGLCGPRGPGLRAARAVHHRLQRHPHCVRGASGRGRWTGGEGGLRRCCCCCCSCRCCCCCCCCCCCSCRCYCCCCCCCCCFRYLSAGVDVVVVGLFAAPPTRPSFPSGGGDAWPQSCEANPHLVVRI